jgi:hypothetical protein
LPPDQQRQQGRGDDFAVTPLFNAVWHFDCFQMGTIFSA